MSEKNTGTDVKYATVPLRSKEITVGIVQSKLNIYDPDKSDRQIKENLDRMLWLVDQAQDWDLRRDIKKDLLIFHEFPLQGFHIAGNREDEVRLAIDIPGPETEAIGKKTKEYNCYITFGCYGKLKDWPGHFIDMGIIIGPTGEIIYQIWKHRQLSGLAFSTSIYDVLDEYVERYGWDAVFPVARTDIGNLALAPCVYEPEAVRAYALKGAEIVTRIMAVGAGFYRKVNGLPAMKGSGPFHNLRFDLQACCMVNDIYGAFVNHATTPDNAIGDRAAGASAIYDSDGCLMAEAMSSQETMVIATIPIASFREKHQIPNFPKELYTDMYQNYVPKYPSGALLGYLPKDKADAITYFKSLARW
jgi:predicted amidohydrolase